MKIQVVQSLKCGGATTVSLNLALAQKQIAPHLHVGVLQMNLFADLHTYCGGSIIPTIDSLVQFLKSDEWGDEVLENGSYSYFGVDVWEGYSGNNWKDLEIEHFKTIWDALKAKYDVLIIDIERGIPDFIQDIINEAHPQNILVVPVSPSALAILPQYLHTYFRTSTYHLVLNQSPLKQELQSKAFLGAQEPFCVGVLPREDRSFWEQVYEGVPICSHKKSPWRKALLETVDTLNTQYND